MIDIDANLVSLESDSRDSSPTVISKLRNMLRLIMDATLEVGSNQIKSPLYAGYVPDERVILHLLFHSLLFLHLLQRTCTAGKGNGVCSDGE